MDVEQSDWVDSGEKDENGEPKMEMVTKTEEQTVNSMIPIWQRSRKEATDRVHRVLQGKSSTTRRPAGVIRVNAEGLISYRALLFIPSKVPANMYTRDADPGLEPLQLRRHDHGMHRPSAAVLRVRARRGRLPPTCVAEHLA